MELQSYRVIKLQIFKLYNFSTFKLYTKLFVYGCSCLIIPKSRKLFYLKLLLNLKYYFLRLFFCHDVTEPYLFTTLIGLPSRNALTLAATCLFRRSRAS